ncbi:MAG: hypothetical protein ISS45_07595 [Candidatus Omnitrophica bacterium]|nr:hypothetical protein [Candidatus Omnitrophota bacterium]
MVFRIRFLVVFCLCMSLAFCAFAQPKDNLYSNTLLGFSIKLPEGWSQEGDMQSGGVIEGRIRLVDGQNTMLITVMKGPAFKNFKEEVKSQISGPGVTLEEELDEINLNGQEGLKTTIHFFERNIKVKMLAYFLNTPEAGYVINAAAIDAKDFDVLKPILEKIVESVRITK